MIWTEEEYADYLARKGKAPGKTPEKQRPKYPLVCESISSGG